MATSSIPALVNIYTNPPSSDSKESADSSLKALYPASGAAIRLLLPPQKLAEWFSDAGETQMNLGSESNAILAFSDAIKLDPTNDAIYLNRASAKIQIQDLAGGLSDLSRTIDLNSSNQFAFSLSGWCKSELQDFTGAEADFTTAIKLGHE